MFHWKDVLCGAASASSQSQCCDTTARSHQQKVFCTFGGVPEILILDIVMKCLPLKRIYLFLAENLLDLGYFVVSGGLLKAIISWSGREHLLGGISIGVLYEML